MNFFKRAILYLIRKKGKAGSLLLLILIVATLVLSGTAIKTATKTAQLNVRQALGGIFTLSQNTSDPGKWVNTPVGNYGSQSYYGGAPLTTELADAILQNVAGIRGYNASYTSYVVAANTSGETLTLLDSAESDNSIDALLSGYGDFNSTVSTYASTNTEFDSYFSGGYLTLTEGRHLTSADKNAVLISQEFAELNNLKVGDKITLHMSEFKASMCNIDVSKTKIEVDIVGLFHATSKSTTTLSNWSMDNSIYTTLDVVHHVRPDTAGESYEKIQFYVSDPGQLDNIVRQVEALDNFDPTDFIINADSSNVDAVMKPLANMNRLVTILTGLILVIGAAILYLVLASRIRERIYESGILLSLGLPKRKIIAQYLVEMTIIALLAFTLSIFCSGILAQNAGNQLLDYTMADTLKSTSTDTAQAGFSRDGITISGSEDYAPKFEGQNEMTQIKVGIESQTIVALYGFGLLIVGASVIMAAYPVLKMKPKEILSTMH